MAVTVRKVKVVGHFFATKYCLDTGSNLSDSLISIQSAACFSLVEGRGCV